VDEFTDAVLLHGDPLGTYAAILERTDPPEDLADTDAPGGDETTVGLFRESRWPPRRDERLAELIALTG